MSRTKHSLPRSCHRNMKHLNQRKLEMSSLDQINEEHLRMKVRHLCRILGYNGRIPDPSDDFKVSAWSEFHNKHFYDKENENV